MHNEGYSIQSCPCVCVCLSVKSHLTPGTSVRHENTVTYLVGNRGQNICGVLSEMQRSAVAEIQHFSVKAIRSLPSMYV